MEQLVVHGAVPIQSMENGHLFATDEIPLWPTTTGSAGPNCTWTVAAETVLILLSTLMAFIRTPTNDDPDGPIRY